MQPLCCAFCGTLGQVVTKSWSTSHAEALDFALQLTRSSSLGKLGASLVWKDVLPGGMQNPRGWRWSTSPICPVGRIRAQWPARAPAISWMLAPISYLLAPLTIPEKIG
jgi:hypothetical protein